MPPTQNFFPFATNLAFRPLPPPPPLVGVGVLPGFVVVVVVGVVVAVPGRHLVIGKAISNKPWPIAYWK